jgi:hypothetical protein
LIAVFSFFHTSAASQFYDPSIEHQLYKSQRMQLISLYIWLLMKYLYIIYQSILLLNQIY